MSTTEQRQKMAQTIVDWEARRNVGNNNQKGHIRIYSLPSADGGGKFEYAGINDRYHPEVLKDIMTLLRKGDYDGAEARAVRHIAEYTDVVTLWITQGFPAIEMFLRDSCFNRGPKGAARILQIALGVADDGKFGPKSKLAFATAIKNQKELLKRLRFARESYENRVAPPVGERAKFWNGLVNRWNKCYNYSLSFL